MDSTGSMIEGRQAHSRLSSRWPALLVFAVALGARLLYVWSVWGSPPLLQPMGDAELYHEKALAILSGDWLGDRVFFQDPLYPYFLAILYALFGEGSVIVLCVQAVLGAATAAFVFFIGRETFGPRRGLLAGLLFAIYGVALYYDALLLKVSLSLFLSTLGLWLVLRAEGRAGSGGRAVGRWLGAGFAFGLATLTRGNYLLFIPLLLLWIALGSLRGSRSSLAALAAGLGIALAILPVTLRNAAVSGEFVLITSQAGQNFYVGNTRDNYSGALKVPPFVRPHPRYEEEDMRAEAERRAGRSLSPSELSRFWFREGLAEIQADPAHFARHATRKLWLFSNDYEAPDNYSYDYFRREVRSLLRLPLPSWGLVFPLALFGMGLAWRNRRAWLLTLYSAAYAFSIALFYTSSRYRMPMVPIVLVFAAGAAAQLVAALRMRRARILIPAFVFLALAWPFAHRTIVEDDLSRFRLKVGIRSASAAEDARAAALEHRRSGDEAAASAALLEDAQVSAISERELLLALEARPRSARVRCAFEAHMVRRIEALDALGEHAAALDVAERLVHTVPELAIGQALLGAMYARVGREALAISILERTLEDHPGSERARAELSRLRKAKAETP
jgi:4-amino-4-deoxy-L-arabinose transferase-like glycosyltransferase